MVETKWRWSDWLILAYVPVGMGITFLNKNFHWNTNLYTNVGIIWSVLWFFFAVYFKRDVLKTDWVTFKQRKKVNWLLVVGVLIAFGVSQIIFQQLLMGKINISDLSIGQKFQLFITSFLTSIMAPFTEEIIFRYELFYRFKNGKKSIFILMAFVSSLLFGLAHFISGDSLIGVCSLILVALVMTLFYKLSNSIWVSLMGHFIWNFVLSAPAIIVILFNISSN